MITTIALIGALCCLWPAHLEAVGSTTIDETTVRDTLRIGSETNHLGIGSTGLVTLVGTGRVTIDMWLGAAGVRAPGGKPADFKELGLTGVWEFGDEIEANQETVAGTLKIPTDMDRTVVPIFKIGWSAGGVSPGVCEWQLEYLWIGPGEATSAAAQETLTATGTAPATGDGLVITAFSGIDLPGATDQAMLFRIMRLSDGGSDTIAAAVHMRGRLFTYTMDKLGTGL